MDDVTVVVRYGKRHFYYFVRNLRQSWKQIIDSNLALILHDLSDTSTSPSSSMMLTDQRPSWKLVGLNRESRHYVSFAPEETIARSIAFLTTKGREMDNGRLHVTLVLCDPHTGVFPPEEMLPELYGEELVFIPSNAPVQLPKSLVEFIDHLRPSAQVS